jgi:hypothetical protein
MSRAALPHWMSPRKPHSGLARAYSRRTFSGSSGAFTLALEEGAQFVFLTNPVALLGGSDGRVAQVRCGRMELGEPDTQGRRKPRPIAGSEFVLPADIVLIVYGFDPAPFSTPEWPGKDRPQCVGRGNRQCQPNDKCPRRFCRRRFGPRSQLSRTCSPRWTPGRCWHSSVSSGVVSRAR